MAFSRARCRRFRSVAAHRGEQVVAIHHVEHSIKSPQTLQGTSISAYSGRASNSPSHFSNVTVIGVQLWLSINVAIRADAVTYPQVFFKKSDRTPPLKARPATELEAGRAQRLPALSNMREQPGRRLRLLDLQRLERIVIDNATAEALRDVEQNPASISDFVSNDGHRADLDQLVADIEVAAHDAVICR